MASPSRTWAGAVWGCFAGALIGVLPFSLTRCTERCITTPKLRLWDAPASSEFGPVLPGVLRRGYPVSFCEVRSNAGLKRKTLWPEVGG